MPDLKKLLDEAIVDFPPKVEGGVVVETYCNLAVNHISRQFFFLGFQGLLANDIVRKMRVCPDFANIDGAAAQAVAKDGKLVIAGALGEPHGHVAVVYPSSAEMAMSGNWKKRVPWVANVGQRNGVMSASYAFRIEPEYFAYIGYREGV